jgi:hypothetical protein
MLPASVQVCPVEIPGRGRREGERPINDVRELARLLARSLPLSDKPYAIFGTCLGAIVGYEIAREVEETRCAPIPVALFTAAVSPPHLYAVAVMKLYLKRRLGESLLHCCCATRGGSVRALAAPSLHGNTCPCTHCRSSKLIPFGFAPAVCRPQRGSPCGGGDGHPAHLAGTAQGDAAQGL